MGIQNTITMLSSDALMSSGVPESWVVVAQALLATLMTWGLTAAGAAVVFLLEPQLLPDPVKDAKFKKSILDGMLGFAAGVMLAASYWSLLAPSIEAAAELGYAGCAEPHAALDKDACIEKGAQWSDWSWFPAVVGLMAGAIALSLTDKYLPTDMVSTVMGSENEESDVYDPKRKPADLQSQRRVLLLVVAITLHNLPEGLAVGVAFGGIDGTSMNFEKARAIAWGIGLQNFPEGLAGSLPLRGQGMGLWRSFMWGQLSGAVEPLAGILGAILVQLARPVLPYALAYAAGAMIFVVLEELVPEAHKNPDNKGVVMAGVFVGFVTMMAMDVGLG